MIRERGSLSLRIVDVSDQANVGVPTIYYHFDSKTQLIAEAQISNYLALQAPMHTYTGLAEAALTVKDETAFWNAIGDDMVISWKSGSSDDRWSVVKLLLDIWSDPEAQRLFCHGLDTQLDRWVRIIGSAKELGWIAEEIDGHALIAAVWSASIGQAILSDSSRLEFSPESIRDFFIRAVGPGNTVDPIER